VFWMVIIVYCRVVYYYSYVGDATVM